MSGIEFYSDYNATRPELILKNLANLDTRELLESLAQLGEQQSKRRIADEKESPDGDGWQDWSSSYAGTRHNGQSLLQGDGALLESIASTAPSGDEIAWGSDLIYAAVHNFGHEFDDGRQMPQRQYLGLSDANQNEMEDVAIAFIGSAIN